MKKAQEIFLVLTAILLLLPSAVSFSHLFLGHSHNLCDKYAEQHYHKKSLDCELHKFQKNPALEIQLSAVEIPVFNEPKLEIYNHYQFLSDYQRLPFELRGPPASV
ncbi:hypothetical protein [Salegentibacter chungangensis]|uniref:Uncharacterized protein n=1 Tax=Salegentibacter chungangensis TaxID=1335724 RepID=A0ABW3NT33_9FLAO